MVGSLVGFADGFQPSRFDSFKAPLSLNEILSAHIDWTIAVPQHDPPPSAEKDDAYEEEQEEEEEGREDDKHGKDDVECVARAIGSSLGPVILCGCKGYEGVGEGVLDSLEAG